MQPTSLHIDLPDWLTNHHFSNHYRTLDARIVLVQQLVDLNIQHQSGGPFAAAVFDTESYECLAAATNRVVNTCCSMAHAEMLALSLAQQALQTHDLSSSGRNLQLVSSAEPCAMCTGALPWSGISELVFCALKSDVEVIGFDEGYKPENWQQELELRGIRVIAGVQRHQAAEQLHRYAQAQQPLY